VRPRHAESSGGGGRERVVAEDGDRHRGLAMIPGRGEKLPQAGDRRRRGARDLTPRQPRVHRQLLLDDGGARLEGVGLPLRRRAGRSAPPRLFLAEESAWNVCRARDRRSPCCRHRMVEGYLPHRRPGPVPETSDFQSAYLPLDGRPVPETGGDSIALLLARAARRLPAAGTADALLHTAGRYVLLRSG